MSSMSLALKRILGNQILSQNVVKVSCNGIHMSSNLFGVRDPGQYKNILTHSKMAEGDWGVDLGTWTDNNKMIYPPLKDKVRPAELYYGRNKIRHSPKKLWYITKVILNKNVDEAIAHLSSIHTFKGAEIMIDILNDAKEEAANKHNVEYPSNMQVISAKVLPAGSRKFPRWHGKGRMNINKSYWANVYILLREGSADLSRIKAITTQDVALAYMKNLRSRTIIGGL